MLRDSSAAPRSLPRPSQTTMANIRRFLAFALQLSVCRALVCSPPFTNILNVCLHLKNITRSWCDAQAYCSSVGGELVRGSNFLPLDGKIFRGMPDFYWIGMTDFLLERRLNKAGWQWSDGSVDPPSSQLAWRPQQPSKAKKDCVSQCLASGQLCCSACQLKLAPMCQPRPQLAARAAHFQVVSIPDQLAEDESAQGGGCSKLVSKVMSSIECVALCGNEGKGWCVSFYFNEEKRMCRFVLYTDATIKWSDEEGWKKFVMIN